jgi:hypothetical protein
VDEEDDKFQVFSSHRSSVIGVNKVSQQTRKSSDPPESFFPNNE